MKQITPEEALDFMNKDFGLKKNKFLDCVGNFMNYDWFITKDLRLLAKEKKGKILPRLSTAYLERTK